MEIELAEEKHNVPMPSDEVLSTSLLIWLSPGGVLPVSSAQLNHPIIQHGLLLDTSMVSVYKKVLLPRTIICIIYVAMHMHARGCSYVTLSMDSFQVYST